MPGPDPGPNPKDGSGSVAAPQEPSKQTEPIKPAEKPNSD